MKKSHVTRFLAVLVLVLAVVVACNREGIVDQSLTPGLEESKLITFSSEVIPGSFIVVLNSEKMAAGLRSAGMSYAQRQQVMKDHALKLMNKHNIAGDKIDRTYSSAIQGFSLANVSDAEVQKLLADPDVQFIEQDQTISLQGGPPGGGGGGSCANGNNQIVPCGIAEVNGGATYTGTRKAYVLDTGIDLTHPDLNVNAALGFNAFTTGQDGGTLNDLNGHGSHVAGTIAAKNNSIGVVGVAAGATVVPVKVLNKQGSGSISGVIAGVDFVGANGTPGDVANMSLTGGASSALDNAVVNASSDGTWFVLAAGNNGSNANNYSPARANANNVRTISAMNCAGNWASFSNYNNPPVDYCAPGVSVCSTYKNGGYASVSGTSMAAPHAAGVILASGGNPDTCGVVNNDPDNTDDPRICL